MITSKGGKRISYRHISQGLAANWADIMTTRISLTKLTKLLIFYMEDNDGNCLNTNKLKLFR